MIACDTDVLTEILLGDPPFVARAVTIPPHEQVVPVVVIEEILRGRLQVIRQAEASQARVNLLRAYDLFEQTLQDIQQVTILSYTLQADSLYLQWRHQRIRVGTHDLRIAAICVAHGATCAPAAIACWGRNFAGIRVTASTRGLEIRPKCLAVLQSKRRTRRIPRFFRSL